MARVVRTIDERFAEYSEQFRQTVASVGLSDDEIYDLEKDLKKRLPFERELIQKYPWLEAIDKVVAKHELEGREAALVRHVSFLAFLERTQSDRAEIRQELVKNGIGKELADQISEDIDSFLTSQLRAEWLEMGTRPVFQAANASVSQLGVYGVHSKESIAAHKDLSKAVAMDFADWKTVLGCGAVLVVAGLVACLCLFLGLSQMRPKNIFWSLVGLLVVAGLFKLVCKSDWQVVLVYKDENKEKKFLSSFRNRAEAMKFAEVTNEWIEKVDEAGQEED